MPNKNPAEITRRYFESIRAQDVAGVLALFASDATYIMPDGRAFVGAEQIGVWFTKLFASLALNPQAVATVAGDSSIAVEIENVLPDGSKRNTANFFHLGPSGLITQLSVYQRG